MQLFSFPIVPSPFCMTDHWLYLGGEVSFLPCSYIYIYFPPESLKSVSPGRDLHDNYCFVSCKYSDLKLLGTVPFAVRATVRLWVYLQQARGSGPCGSGAGPAAEVPKGPGSPLVLGEWLQPPKNWPLVPVSVLFSLFELPALQEVIFWAHHFQGYKHLCTSHH